MQNLGKQIVEMHVGLFEDSNEKFHCKPTADGFHFSIFPYYADLLISICTTESAIFRTL